MDEEKDLLIFPIDAYTRSEGEFLTMHFYKQIRRMECMRELGEEYTPKQLLRSRKHHKRPYGIWNTHFAALHGYFLRDFQIYKGGLVETEPTEREQGCIQQIDAEVHKLDIEYGLENLDKIIQDFENQAYQVARQHPDWGKTREQWKKCMSSKYREYTPPNDDESWVIAERIEFLKDHHYNEEQRAGEEEINLASNENSCDWGPRVTLTLGSLEATEQQKIIEQNQKQLEDLKEGIRKETEYFKQYIAEHQ